MKKFILILLLLMLVVIPASAKIQITAEPIGTITKSFGTVTEMSYDASPEGYGISRISIDAPTGTVVAFTLTYGNGSTVTGSYSYLEVGPQVASVGTKRSTINLGGITNTYDYIGSSAQGRIYITGYAKNISDDETTYTRGMIIGGGTVAPLWMNDYVFYSTQGESDGVIYKVEMTSSNPVGMVAWVKSRTDLAGDVNKSFLDVIAEFVDFAIKMASSVIGFATGAYNAIIWLMAHWMLIAGLYLTITLAVAVNSSKDVFSALKKWLTYQKTLYEFIMKLWETLINIIAQFRGIFRL